MKLSPALSLLARPGDGSIAGRKIVLQAADGVNGESLLAVHAALVEQGAVPRIAAPRIGPVRTADGVALQADVSLENEPGFLFDAMVLPDGEAAVQALLRDGHTHEVIRDQYRHCKAILALGTGLQLLQAAGVGTATASGEADPGIVVAYDAASGAAAFIQAIAKHRHFERETDPPVV